MSLWIKRNCCNSRLLSFLLGNMCGSTPPPSSPTFTTPSPCSAEPSCQRQGLARCKSPVHILLNHFWGCWYRYWWNSRSRENLERKWSIFLSPAGELNVNFSRCSRLSRFLRTYSRSPLEIQYFEENFSFSSWLNEILQTDSLLKGQNFERKKLSF